MKGRLFRSALFATSWLVGTAAFAGDDLGSLIDRLDHNDETVRAGAVLLLLAHGGKAAEALPALRELAADDPSPEVQRRAQEAALSIWQEVIDDSAAAGDYLEIMRHFAGAPPDEVRDMAVRALRRMPQDELEAALKEALDGDVAQRLGCLRLLPDCGEAAIGVSGALEEIVEFDRDAEVRDAANMTLERLEKLGLVEAPRWEIQSVKQSKTAALEIKSTSIRVEWRREEPSVQARFHRWDTQWRRYMWEDRTLHRGDILSENENWMLLDIAPASDIPGTGELLYLDAAGELRVKRTR